MGLIDTILGIINRFHDDLRRLSESIKDQTEATKKASNTQHDRNIPQPFSVIVPEGIENRKAPSDKEAEASYQRKVLFWQRWTFWALVVYAVFTALIYLANKKAATTAAQGLEFTKQQFRMEQRPYLSPEGRGGTSLPGGKTAIIVEDPKTGIGGLAVGVDLRNVGRSPAIETYDSATEYKIGPRDIVRQEVQQYKPKYPTGAGSVVTMGSAVTAQSNVRTLTRDELSHIKDGTWELYIVGGVEYRDIFKPRTDRPYESTYCYVFTASGMPLHDCPFAAPSFGNSIE